MPEQKDFAPYRAQMTANDLAHQALMLAVIIMMFWMAYQCHSRNDAWYATWIPFLGCTMLGLATKLETVVHRLGGFLGAHGDPWEAAIATHAPTKYLIPWADVYIMVPVFVLVIYAEVCVWEYFAVPITRWVYLVGTSTLLGGGVAGWITGGIMAKTGFKGGS